MLAGGRSQLKCFLALVLVEIVVWSSVVDSIEVRNTTEPWQYFWSRSDNDTSEFIEGIFYDGFVWGAGSSAYQTEGAWKKFGKSPSLWDNFTQTSGKIPVSDFMKANHVQESIVDDNSSLSTGNVATDSYFKTLYDAQLLTGLGTSHYRFSLSWSRIFPNGNVDGTEQANQMAVDHYNDVINELIARGFTPVVTLHHFDMPLVLAELGGWLNFKSQSWFEQYANFCFNTFGDRVKDWVTMYDPYTVAWKGYGSGKHPPGPSSPESDTYEVGKNLLLAHAAAWKIYNNRYRSSQDGRVSIALSSDWYEPADATSQQDVDAAIRASEFRLGFFANPVFINGDFPQIMKDQVASKSAAGASYLPTLSAEEKTQIKGSADCFILIPGTAQLVAYQDNSAVSPQNYWTHQDLALSKDPSWPQTGVDPAQAPVPWSIRRLLYLANAFYVLPSSSATAMMSPIVVYDSGFATDDVTEMLDDTDRKEYYKSYINEMLKAQYRESVSVGGFYAQLLDSFEWEHGYTRRAGLHYVDFNDPDRPRIPKSSATFYQGVASKNGFVTDQPPTNSMQSTSSSTRDGIASSEFSFTKLEASAIPSAASVSVWKEFNAVLPIARDRFYYGTFPEDFTWSVSSSAYQIEGAWNEDGKGESIWDRFSQTPGNVNKNQTGDVSANSYDKTAEDVNLLKMLGVSHYHFSIAWTRIFPDGTNANLNQAGVDYYNKLINSLIIRGIEPIVTLYHWDLPQALQDVGGFQNDNTIQNFVDYVDFCFNTFGDRVKVWNTFNEPYKTCWLGNGLGIFAPGTSDAPGTTPYLCAHNIIRAHARAYRLYESDYKNLQAGKVGITMSSDWAEPKDQNSQDDVAAADRMLQSRLGWFAHPICKNGDYPEIVKKQVSDKSALQGLPESRLPVFTEAEKREIAGSYDFFGVTSFTSRLVNHQLKDSSTPNYENDRDTNEVPIPGTTTAYPPWQQIVPWGLRRLLNWIDREYGSPPIYIVENGVGSTDPTLDDEERVMFFKSNINEALKAHTLDGVDVRGYSAYSFLDGFQWNFGYSAKFGLFHVDFNDPVRPRTPRRSSIYYNQVIRENGFPPLERDERLVGEFPSDFIWAVATSSYQIEGGWRSDGKAVGIWDKTSHTPWLVADGRNGDVACDSYNKIDTDVALLKNLGVSYYRFSISWPRMVPTGNVSDGINPAAVDYYNRLIDALLAANIKPMVTLYHWDLPLVYQDTFGGWPNSQIIDLFVEYADACFNAFGSKVKKWITFNEPWVFTVLGYSVAVHSPNLRDSGRSDYKAGHNVLLAHAKAYRLYYAKYAAEQQGEVAITCNCDWHEARNMFRETDHDASDRILQFYMGWWAHPIFVNGDYPDVMKELIDARSAAQGEPVSRLPKFTEEEKNLIKGSSDFFGFNHYTTNLAFDSFHPSSINSVGYFQDQEAGTTKDTTWPQSASSWLKDVPWGVRRLLSWIKDQYGDPPILITENGFSEKGSSVELNDYWRTNFYHGYINEVLKAIKLDGVNVTGYTAWSLMDNFEWNSGYSERFGLHWVNFSDPERPRIPKKSTLCLKEIFTKSYPAEGLPACMTYDNVTSPVGGVDKKTNFLGLDLDKEDSQTALYILSATTIAFFATTSMAVFLWSPIFG